MREKKNLGCFAWVPVLGPRAVTYPALFYSTVTLIYSVFYCCVCHLSIGHAYYSYVMMHENENEIPLCFILVLTISLMSYDTHMHIQVPTCRPAHPHLS